jgi:hypothetical protein
VLRLTFLVDERTARKVDRRTEGRMIRTPLEAKLLTLRNVAEWGHDLAEWTHVGDGTHSTHCQCCGGAVTVKWNTEVGGYVADYGPARSLSKPCKQGDS